MICPAVEWNCIAPPERRWIVKDWLPIGTVTSLYGSGGVGKTLIAQQLATSVAAGRAFFGLETTQAPALVIACEDDRDELHRRQVSICATSGVEMTKLGLLSLFPAPAGRTSSPRSATASSSSCRSTRPSGKPRGAPARS